MLEKWILRILFVVVLLFAAVIVSSGIYFYFVRVQNPMLIPYGNMYYGNDRININRIISGIGLIVLDVGLVFLIKKHNKK